MYSFKYIYQETNKKKLHIKLKMSEKNQLADHKEKKDKSNKDKGMRNEVENIATK